MKHKYFSVELWVGGIAEGWIESYMYVLYLAWPEWKGLKFYSTCDSTHLGGNTGGSQGEYMYHKITGNVLMEPWVGLQGANKSAHWDG